MIERIRTRTRESGSDDRGAVLVTVVIVMIVGFIAASVIAASVLFVIRSNDDNRDNLDAFVAAESGRDVAVSEVVNSCSISAPLTGTAPTYTATVYTTEGSQPTDHTGLTPSACPTDLTTFVVIHSIGTGPDGSTAEIDSVYRWLEPIPEQPGGTLAYFHGSVGGQKSIYKGDLVVRKGSYTCPLGATITGDLYVTNGTVSLSQDCHIQGSIYSYGEVSTTSQGLKVDGDILSEVGDIKLANNGAVVGGKIHAGGNVHLSGNGGTKGTVAGTVKAKGTVTVDAGWTVPTTQQFPSAGDPVFSPELDDVFDITAWVDLGKDSWGTTQEIRSGCLENPTSSLPGAGRLIIDYTQCTGEAVTITIGDVSLDRDVVFVVPANKTMKIKFDGSVSSAGPIESAPQLVFIHEDRDATQIDNEPAPTCESNGPDDITTTNQVAGIHARIMVYSPCTIGGSVRVNYSGQFYTAGNTINFNNGAVIDCQKMSWTPVFEEISCFIEEGQTGGGGGAPATLGDLLYQSEK
ncbi:hypothetical protein HF576_18935 [Microbacterium sp. CFH 90308]|uniref:Polymer-forming cytoskeletal protein n=1 Tax=Microbacterium salsuginis TaxID=2722803 RepID=A0ABX1KKM0_9MICO|nr:hypothetical protein [Microbacterium sp. CFH 90308]NLP85911.1 hypothetical protein [Microbacterium sp. CFH 90308]